MTTYTPFNSVVVYGTTSPVDVPVHIPGWQDASGNWWLVSTGNPMPTSDVTLDAAMAGGNLLVSEQTLKTATSTTDTNRIAVSEPDMSPYSGSVSSASTIFQADTTGYDQVVVQVTNAGVGTITYEGSNDNTNWVAVYGISPGTAAALVSPYTSTGVTGIFIFPCSARYFRARVSAYTSGTMSIVAELRTSVIIQLDPQATSRGTVPGTATAGSAFTASFLRILSAASTNSTLIKSSTGTLMGLTASNTGAGAAYIKFYNKLTAPTVGTDTPVLTFAVPAGQTINIYPPSFIANCTTGAGLGITGAYADTDTTAVTAGQVIIYLQYK